MAGGVEHDVTGAFGRAAVREQLWFLAAVLGVAGCGRFGFDPEPPEGCIGLEDADVFDGDSSTCYALFLGERSWLDASLACEERGAHLVAINNAAENGRVTSLAPAGDRTWIGASDLESEGLFVWVTGESFGFTDWIAGQPDDEMGDEDCVEIRRDDGSPEGWNDLSCELLRPYICER
jgi:hypothetical protein